MNYIIGLDIGTTGCKATLFSKDGAVCQKAYREYVTQGYDGMIDPELVWQNVKEVLTECAKLHPDIEAICTASFGETVVAVDHCGQALAPAILYTNSNAEAEWKEIDDAVGSKRIGEITGLISHPMYTISRLMWIKKHQPEIYEKTKYFLFFASYIEQRMGGDFVAEDTLASRSMAYDVKNGAWSEEILEKAGISKDKMAEIVTAGEIIGCVSADICKEIGFGKTPLLIAGGHDQPCVALGMGAIHRGDAAYGMGTVECLTLILDDYQQDNMMQEKNLICAPHVVPGKYVTYGVLFSGGVVLQDLRSKLYTKEMNECSLSGEDIYEIMMDDMPTADTDVLYLPHLAGSGTPNMDTSDRGGIYGMSLETKKGELVKAALEGIAFDMHLNIENMKQCGLFVKRIMAGGGGAKSDKGLQVRADILQTKLLAANDIQAGTRGVFYIAARALGWIKDYELSTLNYQCHLIEPNKEKEKIAARKYHRYIKFYECTRAL